MAIKFYPYGDKRRLVRLAGDDTRDFLQGILTNDVTVVSPERSIYAGLLTPQGKYVADFIVSAGPDDSIRLDVADEQLDMALQRLTMYRLRSKVDITTADHVEVASVFGDGVHDLFQVRDQAGTTAVDDGVTVISDPRTSALGLRLYGTGLADQFSARGISEASRSDWDAWRIQLAVPEGGVDLQSNEWFPLDLGFERLHGVDFHKGCYVGQEVTARMHHKSERQRGICRVDIRGDAPPVGTPIVADGKEAGTMLTAVDSAGLAFVRWNRVDSAQDISAGDAQLTLHPPPEQAG